MKLHLALALSLLVACKKSEPAKPAQETPPTATERPAPPPPPPELGSGQVGADRRAHNFKDIDTNGDGVISDEERAAARRKRMEGMRAKLDTNGDGKLTPDELKGSTGRVKFDNAEELDTNKDGDISIEELEAGFKARRDALRATGAGSGVGSARVDETP